MSQRHASRILVVVVAAGILIRLVLATSFGGFHYDVATFIDWSWHLHHRPLDRFYSEAAAPDHLPGDLWFLLAIAKLYAATGGTEFGSETYRLLLVSIPTTADMLVSLTLFVVVRARQPAGTALAASALYLLNPATILLTAVWGQWDALSMAFILTALAIIVHHASWWPWTTPLLMWGVLVKPPLALMALLVIVFAVWEQSRPWSRHCWRRSATKAGIGFALALITAWLLIYPFGLRLAGGSADDQLLHRIRIAVDLYPYRTLSASNVWMLGQGSLSRIDDREPLWHGMSAHLLGNVLLLGGLLLVAGLGVVVLSRRSTVDRLAFSVWLMMLANMAIFMLPTRVHERYLFPALVCGILFTGLRHFDRGSVVTAILLSLSFFTNVGIVYGGFKHHFAPDQQAWIIGDALIWIALLNLGAWGTMLYRFGWWKIGGSTK